MSEGTDLLMQEWTLYRCPSCGAVGDDATCAGLRDRAHERVLMEPVQVVPASLLREVEAERDRFLSALKFYAESEFAGDVAREALAPQPASKPACAVCEGTGMKHMGAYTYDGDRLYDGGSTCPECEGSGSPRAPE